MVARVALLGVVALVLAWILPTLGIDSELKPVDRAAVERFLHARKVLAETRDARIDDTTRRELATADPINTGIVGVDWSHLVSTQGDLDAKRLSAHPAWVVLFRRWLEEAGLKPGQTVGVGSSGSFPGLYLSARVAAESLGLKVRAVGSLAASNHGATIPQFDLWEMERALVRGAGFPPAIEGLTPGGDRDAATGFEDADRAALLARLESIASGSDAPLVLVPESAAESLAFREKLFFRPKEPISLYINIGGHATNLGTGSGALALPRGLIRPGEAPPSGGGMVAASLARGVPVLNILDLRGILAERGWALDPMSDRIPAVAPLPPWRRALALMAAVALPAFAFVCRPPRGTHTPTFRKEEPPCAF